MASRQSAINALPRIKNNNEIAKDMSASMSEEIMAVDEAFR